MYHKTIDISNEIQTDKKHTITISPDFNSTTFYILKIRYIDIYWMTFY